jgi:hypothetical protein
MLYRAERILIKEITSAEAKSLNQNGTVGGKIDMKNKHYDFIVSSNLDNRMWQITDPRTFPLLNNKDEMMNMVIKTTESQFINKQSVYYSFYVFNPVSKEFEVKGDFRLIGNLVGFFGGDLPELKPNVYLRGFNDKGECLYTNHEDPSQVTASIFFTQDAPYIISGKYIGAINNNSEALVTVEDEGILGYRTDYRLKIVDRTNQEIAVVANEALLGVAMNDRRDVIAVNKDASEGFFWSETGGLLSLGSFIPVALNNNGDIVGTMHINLGLENSSWLRKSDGTLIDLSEVVDLEELDITKIISVAAINDKGQILINAIVDYYKKQPFLLNPIEK